MNAFSKTVAPLSLTFLVCLAAVYMPLAQASEEILFQSPEKQTTRIELFTAEGCSSCPPAEAWLSRLRDRPGLWKTFVPVAFHVDYWDKRGWKDRLASPAFTQRQRAYAASWKSGAAYTPAFAVNGREERSPVLPAQLATVGALRILRGPANSYIITFAPEAAGSSRWDVSVVLLGSDVTTRVSAGENAGRELRHDFVVLDYKRLKMEFEGNRLGAQTSFPPGEINEISRPALAAWVSARSQLSPVQATGGWLPSVGR